MDYHLCTYSKASWMWFLTSSSRGPCLNKFSSGGPCKSLPLCDSMNNFAGITIFCITLQILHALQLLHCIFLCACRLEADRATLSYPARRSWALLETEPSLGRRGNTFSKPVYIHGLNEPSKSNTWHQHWWGSLLCQQPQTPSEIRVLRASPGQSWEGTGQLFSSSGESFTALGNTV